MLAYAKDEERLRELDIRWREPKPGIEKSFAAAGEAWESANVDPVAATRIYRRALRAMRDELEPAVFRYDHIDEADNMGSPKPRPNLIF
ncbi:hypothetical protein D9V29_14090 [Mycetocola manganoxydans]|uniref:Uncharacterized protein n=2 Tax=Mycetocola manganoxydans TaxID=699879 RepID=A0A3L6ZK68_9MICO|nr:hypothetical protein D9V29_14090 [Mycetocola manganoxydans]GHD52501.1 hypothetical protein GCM10008097_28440 [Mycetocola manganoxydans]